MSGLQGLSDAELLALYHGAGSPAPAGAPVDATPNPDDVQEDNYGSHYRDARVPTAAPSASPAVDLSKLSDDDLKALYDSHSGIVNNVGRSFASGVPVIGGLLDKADAATNAALAPVLNPLFAPKDQLSEPTWSERYAHSLRDQQGMDQRFAADHPVIDAGAKIAGGAAAMVPAIAAAPYAFGVGGTLPGMIARGAASGAALGGADAAARGEDIGRGALWGGGLGAAGPMVGRAVGAAFSPSATDGANDIAGAAGRLGVGFPKIAASDSLITQRAGSALKEMPVIGDPLVRASRAANEQLGSALQRVEQGYGSGSMLNSGEVAKDAITDWIGPGSRAIGDRLYGNLDRFVKPNVLSDLDATRGVIADIAAERQAAGLGASRAIDHVLEGVQRPEGLTAAGLKTLRTSIGEKLDNGLLPADISKSELKRLYGGLSQDLEDAVYNSGLRERNGRFQKRSLAPDAFDKANGINSMIAGRREALAKIVGTDASAAPERVVDRLIGFASTNSRADVNKLLLARKAIGGENWNEVASGIVSRMGRDVDGKFSPERFITSYGKISADGKRLLFASTGRGDLHNALEDIATLSRRAKELNAYGNPSGTGRVVSALSTAGAVFTHPHVAIPAAIGGRLAARALGAPVKLRPSTIQAAQRSRQIAALIQHVMTPVAFGAEPGLSDQSKRPLQIAPPSAASIPAAMHRGHR